jgi:hypothetical protein
MQALGPSALHLGEAAGAGEALRGGAVDVGAVRGVALVLAEARLLRVLAEARLLRAQRRAAPQRDRPAEQRGRARAQRRRVARRRRQQDGAQQRQRHRLLAHSRRPPIGLRSLRCFWSSGRPGRRAGMGMSWDCRVLS